MYQPISESGTAATPTHRLSLHARTGTVSRIGRIGRVGAFGHASVYAPLYTAEDASLANIRLVMTSAPVGAGTNSSE